MGLFHYNGNSIVAQSTAITLQANRIKMDYYLSVDDTPIYKDQLTKNRTDLQYKNISYILNHGYILNHVPHTKRWGSNWATREERTLIMGKHFETSLGMRFLPENSRKIMTIILKNAKIKS